MFIAPTTFRGIEFVRISDLPIEHRKLLSKTLDEMEVINILMDDTILRDCIQFKDYIKCCSLIHTVRADQSFDTHA